MKLDKDFQDKFLSYLNGLSEEEFLAIIENPTVNVDFLMHLDQQHEKSDDEKPKQPSFLNRSLNFAYSPKQSLLTGSPNESTKITPERAKEILENIEYLMKEQD